MPLITQVLRRDPVHPPGTFRPSGFRLEFSDSHFCNETAGGGLAGRQHLDDEGGQVQGDERVSEKVRKRAAPDRGGVLRTPRASRRQPSSPHLEAINGPRRGLGGYLPLWKTPPGPGNIIPSGRPAGMQESMQGGAACLRYAKQKVQVVSSKRV